MVSFFRESKKNRLIGKSLLSFWALALFLPCSLSYSGPEAPAPKIVSQGAAYDFGTVRPGTTVEHVFILKNQGEANLRIEKLEIKGPVTATGQKETPPGQDLEVYQSLDTSKLRGKVETITILYTNDPAQPQVKLKMEGEVKPALEFRPLPAAFLAAFRGEEKEMALTIINNEEKPVEIVGVEPQSNRFQAQLQEVTRGKEYRLVVKNNPEAAPGRTIDQLLVFTTHPDHPEIKIPVNVFIKDDVYTFPVAISFGKINLSDFKQSLKKNPGLESSLTQTILVKRRPGKGDFQIALEKKPFIEVKKTPNSGSETYRLDVSLIVKKLQPGKIDTSIRVKTNDKEVPELKIPVHGEII